MSSRVGYMSLLKDKKIRTIFFFSLLGRLSFAMVTLALLLGVEANTGSFAIAGISTGAFGLANVISSPYLARMVDRWGQKIVLNFLAFPYSVGLIGMSLLFIAQTNKTWVFVAFSALIGLFMPPLGSAMRVLWASFTPNVQARTKAYSLDSVGADLIYITGPVIISVVVTVISPTIGLVLSAVLAIIGTAGMTFGSFSRSISTKQKAPATKDRPLKQPGFILMLTAIVSSGIVLGFIEVAVPGFAIEQNSPGLSGLLLAVLAVGSLLGGLLYGHFTWKSSLAHRLIVTCFLLTTLCGTLAFSVNIFMLSFGLFIVGVFLTPCLITSFLLVDFLTSSEVKTEAFVWVNTAANAGQALAAAAAGIVIDTFSISISFVFGSIIGLVCVFCALPLVSKMKTR